MASTDKCFICTCMNPSLASKVSETLSLKGDSLLRGDVFLRQISLGSGCLLGDGSGNQSWGSHYLWKSQANILLSIWMTLIFLICLISAQIIPGSQSMGNQGLEKVLSWRCLPWASKVSPRKHKGLAGFETLCFWSSLSLGMCVRVYMHIRVC